jgi:large subunit ribosomal protein L14e
MVSIENGRVCVKKMGRDAGRLCVITSVIDENFAKIICAGRKKKRRCNIRHLEPLPQKIELKESDEEVLKILTAMEREMKS